MNFLNKLTLFFLLGIIIAACSQSDRSPAPTRTPVQVALPAPTRAPTRIMPAATLTPTTTPTNAPTSTPTTMPTATATVTPEPTATATATPKPTSTPAPTATPLPPTATPQPAATAETDTAHLVWQLINQQREQAGLYPLKYNDTLALAAQRHAEDCAQRQQGGHTGSDGSTLQERLARVGYKGKWVSESWAWARSPQQAVAMWLDETPPNDPHRRMLLSDTLQEVGVGVARAQWGYYFIADFGR